LKVFHEASVEHQLQDRNTIKMPSNDSKYDDLHKQLFEEGLKMRRSVVGDKYVDSALANGSTDFSREGQELVTEWCW
jgi:4-carboxymuconolactone decarboxylase